MYIARDDLDDDLDDVLTSSSTFSSHSTFPFFFSFFPTPFPIVFSYTPRALLSERLSSYPLIPLSYRYLPKEIPRLSFFFFIPTSELSSPYPVKGHTPQLLSGRP